MQSPMERWYFMRPGLDTFRLDPDKHSRYLFGTKDQRQRDLLLNSLEEAGYGNDGHKVAVYGDYGRGKTHQCHNIIFEIGRRGLKFAPVYIKCGAYKRKEPFTSLFREFLLRYPTQYLKDLTTEYENLANKGKVAPLEDIVRSEDISHVIKNCLTSPNTDRVKNGLRWLGGEPKINVDDFGPAIKHQITDSGEFGAVLRGLAEMFIKVYEKIPVFIIDEAERFQNITDTDTYFSWLASIRELTEINGVAMIFMIGAVTRDELPTIFVQPEVVRRIGVTNYIEFLNPGRDDIKQFLVEQFQTSIKKGPVPPTQVETVDPDALDEEIPKELQEITGGDAHRLETFPFEPDALDEFITQIAGGESANKPSEAQIRVQKAAQRAMRKGERTINVQIVEEIETEGF